MAKTLTQEQIDNIQSRARVKFNRNILRTARDNFHTIKSLLNSKSSLSEWTIADARELLQAFSVGCTDATGKTCSVVRKEYFKEIEGDGEYEDYEFCRPCFFKNFCAGNPNNRNKDGWHWNMLQLRNHLMQAKSKADLDKQFIIERYQKIQASNDLQDLHTLVEGWIE